jgi:phosphoribosylaminoimidazolecarboxamide formyltransferase / IMP cyclohydrolase
MQEDPFKSKTVFFSCADKTGVPELARALHSRGWTIYSAGGTSKAIQHAGVPVIDISTLCHGVGDMLNHRLLTLCPAVHAPLLTGMSPKESSELSVMGLPIAFEIVVSSLYDIDTAMKQYERGEITFADLWEKIDVGGPAFLKSGFKGLKYLVLDPERQNRLIEWIDGGCFNFHFEVTQALQDAIGIIADREMAHLALFEKYPQLVEGLVKRAWV